MERMTDIFVIGGGINGTAIAADIAGRGLSVTLCEKNDLASGTSSASTKLIHGGLRYLESYEFNLVRKALKEREILMHRAPNLIVPLEFILPHESHLRPAWLIRLGLFFYDHLAKHRDLPNSKSIKLQNTIHGIPLNKDFKKGFSYYDCFTDDARLTLLNAVSAQINNAKILTHTEFVSAQRENNLWKIKINTADQNIIYYAKGLINAAGPWIHQVQKHILDSQLNFKINLIKGSHIILPKLYEGNFAYILQNKDKRIIFSIPYQNDFTLIGTTDINFTNNLDHVIITDEEKEYLINIINHYFQKKISLKDIVGSYAGVRCLQADHDNNPSSITRDYKLVHEDIKPPLLTVIGGKITTHRALAEDVAKIFKPFFPSMGPSWTAKQALPGCDFEKKSFSSFYHDFKKTYSWLPESIALRYAKNYGTYAYRLLNNAKCISELGQDFSAGLYQKEVEYLIQHEWAKSSDDILWRRTKLGLIFSKEAIKNLENWLLNNSTPV